jgi:hypothetical protein
MSDNIITLPVADICGFAANDNICKNPAGFGTSHIGVGSCIYHESQDPMQLIPSAKAYLINSLDPRSSALAGAFLNDPDELYSLKDEIAYMKALLRSLVEEQKNEGYADVKTNIALIKQLTTTIESAFKMEKGIHRYVHVDVIKSYTNLFVDNMRRFIPDPTTFDLFMDELEKGIAETINKSADADLVAISMLGDGKS